MFRSVLASLNNSFHSTFRTSSSSYQKESTSNSDSSNGPTTTTATSSCDDHVPPAKDRDDDATVGIDTRHDALHSTHSDVPPPSTNARPDILHNMRDTNNNNNSEGNDNAPSIAAQPHPNGAHHTAHLPFVDAIPPPSNILVPVDRISFDDVILLEPNPPPPLEDLLPTQDNGDNEGHDVDEDDDVLRNKKHERVAAFRRLLATPSVYPTPLDALQRDADVQPTVEAGEIQYSLEWEALKRAAVRHWGFRFLYYALYAPTLPDDADNSDAYTDTLCWEEGDDGRGDGIGGCAAAADVLRNGGALWFVHTFWRAPTDDPDSAYFFTARLSTGTAGFVQFVTEWREATNMISNRIHVMWPAKHQLLLTLALYRVARPTSHGDGRRGRRSWPQRVTSGVSLPRVALRDAPIVPPITFLPNVVCERVAEATSLGNVEGVFGTGVVKRIRSNWCICVKMGAVSGAHVVYQSRDPRAAAYGGVRQQVPSFVDTLVVACHRFDQFAWRQIRPHLRDPHALQSALLDKLEGFIDDVAFMVDPDVLCNSSDTAGVPPQVPCAVLRFTSAASGGGGGAPEEYTLRLFDSIVGMIQNTMRGPIALGHGGGGADRATTCGGWSAAAWEGPSSLKSSSTCGVFHHKHDTRTVPAVERDVSCHHVGAAAADPEVEAHCRDRDAEELNIEGLDNDGAALTTTTCCGAQVTETTCAMDDDTTVLEHRARCGRASAAASPDNFLVHATNDNVMSTPLQVVDGDTVSKGQASAIQHNEHNNNNNNNSANLRLQARRSVCFHRDDDEDENHHRTSVATDPFMSLRVEDVLTQSPALSSPTADIHQTDHHDGNDRYHDGAARHVLSSRIPSLSIGCGAQSLDLREGSCSHRLCRDADTVDDDDDLNASLDGAQVTVGIHQALHQYLQVGGTEEQEFRRQVKHPLVVACNVEGQSLLAASSDNGSRRKRGRSPTVESDLYVESVASSSNTCPPQRRDVTAPPAARRDEEEEERSRASIVSTNNATWWAGGRHPQRPATLRSSSAPPEQSPPPPQRPTPPAESQEAHLATISEHCVHCRTFIHMLREEVSQLRSVIEAKSAEVQNHNKASASLLADSCTSNGASPRSNSGCPRPPLGTAEGNVAQGHYDMQHTAPSHGGSNEEDPGTWQHQQQQQPRCKPPDLRPPQQPTCVSSCRDSGVVEFPDTATANSIALPHRHSLTLLHNTSLPLAGRPAARLQFEPPLIISSSGGVGITREGCGGVHQISGDKSSSCSLAAIWALPATRPRPPVVHPSTMPLTPIESPMLIPPPVQSQSRSHRRQRETIGIRGKPLQPFVAARDTDDDDCRHNHRHDNSARVWRRRASPHSPIMRKSVASPPPISLRAPRLHPHLVTTATSAITTTVPHAIMTTTAERHDNDAATTLDGMHRMFPSPSCFVPPALSSAKHHRRPKWRL